MRELFGAVYESGFTFTEMTVSSKMEVFGGVYEKDGRSSKRSSLLEGAVEQSETEGVPPSRAWSLPPAVRETGKQNVEGLARRSRD